MTTGRVARRVRVGIGVGIGVVLALLVAVCGSMAAAAAARPGPRVVFHLQDSRLDEASGIGVGVRSRGIDYVENDSGDTHRFFALNAHTGATAAVITVPHATNVDWEDLQVAPDAQGKSSVWIADIGDNDAERHEIDVYRVPEPRVSPDDQDESLRSARPAIWRLRYPSGPTDAESLAVSPQGRAYIVTKNFVGESVVYAMPSRPDAHRVRPLSQVATIDFRITPGSSPVGSLGSVLATSAAISADGALLVVRTYVYAYAWRLHPRPGHDGVEAALRTSPTRIALPAQKQGEGIAVAHGRLLLDSEGVGTPVWSVPLPKALRAGPVTAAVPSGTPSSETGSPTRQAHPTASPSRTRRVPADSGSRRSGLSIVVLLLLFGAVVLIGRRARRYGGAGPR